MSDSYDLLSWNFFDKFGHLSIFSSILNQIGFQKFSRISSEASATLVDESRLIRLS